MKTPKDTGRASTRSSEPSCSPSTGSPSAKFELDLSTVEGRSVSADRAASLLGLSYNTIRRECHANRLGHFKLPGRRGRLRIPVDSLRRYATDQGIAIKADSFAPAVPGLEAVLVVGTERLAASYHSRRREVVQVDNLWLAGVAMARRSFALVVVELDYVGLSAAAQAAVAMRDNGCLARLEAVATASYPGGSLAPFDELTRSEKGK